MLTRWYVAKLILLCRVDNDCEGPWTCEEQIRVLQAIGKGAAYEKAVILGKSAEHSYRNAADQEVVWEFLGISNMDELSEGGIIDGSEITARLFTSSNTEIITRNSEDFVMNWMPQEKNKTAHDVIAESGNDINA